MNTEQPVELTKAAVPVVITPEIVKLKISAEIVKHKLTLPELEARGLKMVKNRDSLPLMKVLLDDLKKVRDLAEEVHENGKRPSLLEGRAWDGGKKLVFEACNTIESGFKAWYDKELNIIATEKQAADRKKAQDDAILAGIESKVIILSNMVVAALTKKALAAVETRIHFEKSPSMAKKYGEHHAKAIERYDSILLPIIKDQKVKVEELENLNTELTAAEANNDPDKVEELLLRVDEKSNEILQNHAVLQESVLNQESFTTAATEILPESKVKRTNYSIEIADVEVALKKARRLLDIQVDKEAAKVVLAELKEKNAFDGKDEIIVDGIKYIATRVREAL